MKESVRGKVVTERESVAVAENMGKGGDRAGLTTPPCVDNVPCMSRVWRRPHIIWWIIMVLWNQLNHHLISLRKGKEMRERQGM